LRREPPVYAVFSNEHLAGMVKKPPKTIKDILASSGVGEARVKQYGETFIKVCLEIAGKTDETPG
jgi:superfamily II DNA helicase RecQ